MIVLLTGGSGCGKSTYAERLMDKIAVGRRYYVATMQVYDEESRRRVERHRAQRAGKGYVTLECPKNLAAAPIEANASVLLECLPNLTANEMFDGGDASRMIPALQELGQKCANLVIVTNDVFSDGEAYSDSVLEYMKRLAEVNAAAAQMADCVAEVVYSIPVWKKGAAPCD